MGNSCYNDYRDDISEYAFWVDCINQNVEISIYSKGKEMYEYYTRKTLLDSKLFIEIMADIPTEKRKNLKVVIKSTDNKKNKSIRSLL